MQAARLLLANFLQGARIRYSDFFAAGPILTLCSLFAFFNKGADLMNSSCKVLMLAAAFLLLSFFSPSMDAGQLSLSGLRFQKSSHGRDGDDNCGK